MNSNPETRGASSSRTLIMGIVNVTPDSFFDGGEVSDAKTALARAEQLLHDGADILDIGGESSRPGAAPVPADEEWKRVGPALEAIRPLGRRVSIDTYHAETARKAISRGATIVNDISALRRDPEMAAVVADAHCECVLMHMLGEPRTMQEAPRYADVIDDLCGFFEERLNYAVRSGIAEEAVWLDPGFGFGKTPEHNLTILRRLGEFRRFGRPILIGTSNKATIGAVLDVPVHDRMEGTAATVALAIANGADCVRVHDVKAMARVARMTDAVVRGWSPVS